MSRISAFGCVARTVLISGSRTGFDAPLGAEPGEPPPDADTRHRRVGGLALCGRHPGPLGPGRPDPPCPGPAGAWPGCR